LTRRPPRSTQSRSSAASDVYKRQEHAGAREVADERTDSVDEQAELARERSGVERVAAVLVARLGEALDEPRRRALLKLVALDEVDVERLVAILGEQQRPRRPFVAPGAGAAARRGSRQ